MWWTGLYNMIFLGLVTVVFLTFGDRIVDLFLQRSGDTFAELADGVCPGCEARAPAPIEPTTLTRRKTTDATPWTYLKKA